MDKARDSEAPQNEAELEFMMTEVEAAKNRFFNRSGFSPVQRVLGLTPRLPGSLLSDDKYDPLLLASDADFDYQRAMAIRKAAQMAYMECDAKDKIGKATRARPRKWVEFVPGEHVFVYRAMKERKRRGEAPAPELDADPNKPRWVGPGLAIMPEEANLWVNMRGELWRRPGSSADRALWRRTKAPRSWTATSRS